MAATHEIGHALGFDHEQSRSDAPDFILFNLQNAIQVTDNLAQFSPFVDSLSNVVVAGCDYCSVMHYPRDAGSANDRDIMTPYFPLFDPNTGEIVFNDLGEQVVGVFTPGTEPNPVTGEPCGFDIGQGDNISELDAIRTNFEYYNDPKISNECLASFIGSFG